eukprot:1802192-Rhodomonas_salina.1
MSTERKPIIKSTIKFSSAPRAITTQSLARASSVRLYATAHVSMNITFTIHACAARASQPYATATYTSY